MATPFKPQTRFNSIFSKTSAYSDEDDDNKIELFHPSQSNDAELTSFNTISPQNVVPLTKLKHWPRAVNCPSCRELSITRVERKICSGTHAFAALMFLCTVVGGPIVYMSKAFKNVEHYCCRCNRRLATFHFNTGTEIHVY